MNRMFFLLLLVLFCLPTVAIAELPQQIAADYAVVEGVVVMPVNQEYIVDLDQRDNLHVGDILSVVDRGKNIFHPKTGEVLGAVDEVLGFMQVTRVYSGYSYAKVLSEDLKPSDGDRVKRFEQVPASITLTGEADAALAQQIRTDLPQFAWQDDPQKALLTFELSAKTLDVSDRQGLSLHKYRVLEDQQLADMATTVRPAVGGAQGKPQVKPLQRLANTIMGAFEETNEERFAEMDEAIIRQRQIDRKGIWMGPNLAGHPNGMAVGDLDGDGQQEVAIALEHSIIVARIIAGEFNQLAEIEVPESLQIFSIDAIDTDANGTAELVVSAVVLMRPASFIVEKSADSYAIVMDNIRWFLRAVDLPGVDEPVLVGQDISNNDRVYTGEVFRMRRDGKELVAGEAVELPDQLNLFNFAAFVDDKGLTRYAYLTDSDYLKVLSAEGDVLWESADYYGGSENCFYAQRERSRGDTVKPTCMIPRMVVMPGNEILVAQNEGQRIVERFHLFKRSRLASMSWNGFALTENWRTAAQPGYLGDFAYADADNDGNNELVMAVKFKHAGISDEARSSVVIYELE